MEKGLVMLEEKLDNYTSIAHKIMGENSLDAERWDFRISCAPDAYKPESTYVAYAQRGEPLIADEPNDSHIGLIFEYALLNNYNEDWFYYTMLHEIAHVKVFEKCEKYYMPKDEATGHGRMFLEEGAKLVHNTDVLFSCADNLVRPMHSWLAFCRYCDKDFYVNEITLERLDIRCADCRNNHPDSYYSWVKTIYYNKEQLTNDIRKISPSGIWRPKMEFNYDVDWLDLGEINENVSLDNFNLDIRRSDHDGS